MIYMPQLFEQTMHQILHNHPNASNIPTQPEKQASKKESKTTFKALSQSVNVKQFTSKQLSRFEEIDTRMEQYIKNHPPATGLTETLIHGDLALEHAQFLPDDSVYFFDFADRIWGPVAQELATFLTMLYQGENIPFTRWEELKRYLLTGYQSVNKLSEDDLHAIPKKELIRILGAIKYLAILARDTPSDQVVNWIRRGYEMGNYILTN